MDEFLDGLDGRLRVSGMVADSIMMGIVNSAMEEAFENVCSKEGDIERLNEKSRFYELAVMQLEWCLKFLQEETDSYVVVESSCEREKLVSDLMETRDRIQRRLDETEFAISEKDKELTERFENELKLRQALELKDREIWSLRTNLELERTKIEGAPELLHSNRVGGDEGRDGDFCELKNSVDLQFWNIKQKLEDERINLTNGMRKMSQGIPNAVNFESDSKLVEEGNCNSDKKEIELYEKDKGCEIEPPDCSLRPELNTGFEKMGSDIDILKETLDLAFGMMDNTISLSEVGPMEQQWKWTIEKGTIAVMFREFLRDVQENLKAKVKEGKKQGPLALLGENWSELMEEITSLRHELELLVSQTDDQVKTVIGHDLVTSPPQTDAGGKIISQKMNWLGGKNSPEANHGSSGPDRYGKHGNTSSKVKEIDHLEEPSKLDPDGQGSLVAEMIKSHEFIIRKKNEELNRVKGEILREKGCLSLKKDKDHEILKKRLEDIIIRLDNIIEGNAKLGATYDDDVISRCVHEKDSINADLSDEIRELKQEREDSDLKSAIMEEFYLILFKSLVKELHLELHNYDAESLIREDVCKVLFREMFNEWNKDRESYNIEKHIREEICHNVYSEAVKDTHCFNLTECQLNGNEDNFLEDSPSSNKSFENVKGLIRDDVCTVFLREMVKEWNHAIENYDIGSHIREEVYHIVFREAVKDIDCTHNFTSIECQGARSEGNSVEDSPSINKLFQNLEGLIQDDVRTIYLREMLKEWNQAQESYSIDNFVREETYRIVFNEVIKDIGAAAKVTLTEYQEARNQDNFQEELPSTNNLFQSLETMIREDVCTVFFRETVNEWKNEIESYNIESLIREEIHQIVICEAVKDINFCLTECQEARNQDNFLEDLPSGHKLPQSVQVIDKKNLIQKLNSLSKTFEVEEDMMLSESSELMERNLHIDLVDLEHEKLDEQKIHFEGMLIQRDELLGSVSNNLEEALQQINMSKAQSRKLGSGLGMAVGDLDEVHDQMTSVEAIIQDREHSLCLAEKNEVVQVNPLGSMITHITEFSKAIVDFECMVDEKIGLNISRLEEVKHQLGPCVEHVTSLRKKELLYRKAFIRRCCDLQKAEVEVDLLGDEVDAFIRLLENIYITMDHYSPVLKHYSGIMEILNLIRNELNRAAACTPC